MQFNCNGPEPTVQEDASDNGALVFSPDGKFLVSSCGNRVRFWDAATGELLKSIPFRVGARLR